MAITTHAPVAVIVVVVVVLVLVATAVYAVIFSANFLSFLGIATFYALHQKKLEPVHR